MDRTKSQVGSFKQILLFYKILSLLSRVIFSFSRNLDEAKIL